MADYSGDWHCTECGASGTNWAGYHKPECSVTEVIAKSKRRATLEAEAKVQRQAERQAAWDDLTDDAVLRKVENLRVVRDRAFDIANDLDADWRTGLRTAQRRGLDWL